jgi:hypothetical protein
MDTSKVIEKLELLENLIGKTEPDIPNETELFSHHTIRTQENLEWLRNVATGRTNHDPDSTRTELIRIMKESNRYWGIRNKIHNGEWDDLQELSIQEGIEDFLADNQKINAIKYYRHEMKEQFGKEIGLREAKDHVDDIHEDMRRTGMIRR